MRKNRVCDDLEASEMTVKSKLLRVSTYDNNIQQQNKNSPPQSGRWLATSAAHQPLHEGR